MRFRSNFISRVFVVMVLGVFGFDPFAWADEVSLSLDKTEILLGDFVTLEVKVESSKSQVARPVLKEIPGLSVKYMGVRQESFSSFTLIVNNKGVQSSKEGGRTIFQYSLTPKAKGEYLLPTDWLVMNNQTLNIEPVTIRVVDEIRKTADIFIQVEADKERVVLGEQIYVTVKWFLKKDVQGYVLNIPWMEDSEMYLMKSPQLDQKRGYLSLRVNGNREVIGEKSQVNIGGVPYAVIQFSKIIVPLKAGVIVLEPIFLRCDVVTGYRKSPRSKIFDSFFSDDFFGFGREAVTESVATRGASLEIQVEKLPVDHVPETFTGAIGQFNFVVSIEPEAVNAGDPVTVSIAITGTGNIPSIKDPIFPELMGVRSYEPEVTESLDEYKSDWRGEKHFRKMYVPSQPGALEIPVISFSYFDTSKREYVTISKGPFTLTVEEGQAKGVSTVVPVPTRLSSKLSKEIEILSEDILYIKDKLDPPRDSSRKRTRKWALVFLYIFWPILVFVVWILRKKQLKDQKNIFQIRRKYALKSAIGHLKKHSKINHSEDEKFYDELMKILRNYFCDKLGLTAATVLGDVFEMHRKNRDPDRVWKKIQDITEKIDYIRFVKKESTSDERVKLQTSVRELIIEADKKL